MKRWEKIKKNSNLMRNIVLIISVIFLIFLVFMIFRGITGNVTANPDTVVVQDQQVFKASNIATTINGKCASKNSKMFAVGKVESEGKSSEESSVFYFNLSKAKNKDIENVEFCIAKYYGNNFSFEFFILPETKLECPNIMVNFSARRSNKIAGRPIYKFEKSKFYCFNVTNYVRQKINNKQKSIFMSVSGMALTKSKQTYNYFWGSSSGVLKPYIKIKYVGENDEPKDCEGSCDDNNPCTTDSCVSGSCNHVAKDCGNNICDITTGNCKECTRNCKNTDGTDKSCGDDGCGGSCGDCDVGLTCDSNFQCIKICKPNWQCTDWSTCANNKLTRTCADSNNCNIDSGKPAEEKNCPIIKTTPDSLGVFTIPVSNFFLTKASANPISFPFLKEKTNVQNSLNEYGGCKAGGYGHEGDCFYTIPKNTDHCNTLYQRRSMYYAGARMGSQVPLIGDWNGDGIDSIGMYDPVDGTFYLKNTNKAGNADLKIKYGKTAYNQLPKSEQYVFGRLAHYLYPLQYPIVGDWDGDGKDTIGLYDPFTSKFYLKNSNNEGNADVIMQYGSPYRDSNYYSVYITLNTDYLCSKLNDYPMFSIIPLVGDWDGDGKDTIGLYDLNEDSFYLTNELKNNPNPNVVTKFNLKSYLENSGTYEKAFCYSYSSYGQLGCNDFHDRLPVAGDWDGDGADEIGIYSQINGNYYLKNDFNEDFTDRALIGYDKLINNIKGPTGDNAVQSGYDRDIYQGLLFKVPLVGHWNDKKIKLLCTPNCKNADGSLKECGDNGCGGQCGNFGKCGVGNKCVNDKCTQCVPKTCAQIGKQCGNNWDNGCGGVMNCGNCENIQYSRCNYENGACINIGKPVNALAGVKPKSVDTYASKYWYSYKMNKYYDITKVQVTFKNCVKQCFTNSQGILLYDNTAYNYAGSPQINLNCNKNVCTVNTFSPILKTLKDVGYAKHINEIQVSSDNEIQSIVAMGTVSQ